MPSVKPKVFIVGNSFGGGVYRRMFEEAGWEVTIDPKEANLFQFTGGEDVSPSLYGELKHRTTYSNSERDNHELVVFHQASDLCVPMAGICRGGQFLNVVNGGSMYQDVNNHTRPHNLLTPDGEFICYATSTHHQMMIPSKDAVVIAIGLESTRRESMAGNSPVVAQGAHDDTEVVYYDATKSLCFQPHPEFGSKELQQFYFKCIKDYLGVSA